MEAAAALGGFQFLRFPRPPLRGFRRNLFHRVRLGFPLLLQQAVNHLADFRQPFAEPAEPRRRHRRISAWQTSLSAATAATAASELLLQLGVKGLGRFAERFVEDLGRQFALFQGFLAGGFLLLALRLIFETNGRANPCTGEIVAVLAQRQRS